MNMSASKIFLKISTCLRYNDSLRGQIFAVHRNSIKTSASKRAKEETSESNPNSLRRSSDQASRKDKEVPKTWFLPGMQDFKMLKQMGAFVDHTLLIEKLLNTSLNETPYQPVFITAPRRFGKSSNLRMLQYFLEIECDKNGKPTRDLTKPVKDTKNYQLFVGTKIMDSTTLVDRHFGRHPVIHLDFKGARYFTFDDVWNHFKNVFHKSIIRYKYLCGKLDEENMFFSSWCHGDDYGKKSAEDIQRFLYRFVMNLYNYFQRKVFILVDEFDAVTIEAIRNLTEKEVENVNKLLMSTLTSVIKGNIADQCVQGAVLTGVSYIAGMGISEELNNVKSCRFLADHKFVEFYGFTESEVQQLDKVFRETNGKDVFQNLTKWYNGYETYHGEKIYSLWSVGRTFQNGGKVDYYWRNTGKFYLLKDLKNPEIFAHILMLLDGKDITIEIQERITVMNLYETLRRDLFFSVMLEQGYLTTLKEEGNEEVKKNKVKVKLPNEEIKSEILARTKEYYEKTWGFDDVKIEECAQFFKNIKSFSTQDDLKSALKRFYRALTELFEGFSDKEIVEITDDHLHSLMYYVLIRAHYRRSTEHWLYCDWGKKIVGRLDLLMLKEGECGIIVEFKCNKEGEKNKSSFAALGQILGDKTKYLSVLSEYKIEKYFLIGISVDNKMNLSISCLLNSMEADQVEHLPDYKTASCT